MNLAKEIDQIEAERGMELLADYVAWINQDGVQAVAAAQRCRIREIEQYQTAFSRLADTRVQAAARQARLSFTVVKELGLRSYAIRNRNDRVELLVRLCGILAAMQADQALEHIKSMMRYWAGDTTKRRDSACMHKHVGRDGKRRFTACLSPAIAARVDSVLHQLATKLKQADPSLQYDHAYAEAFIQKITSSGSSGQRELFGPMFVINTDHRFQEDGTITTTDGALVNIVDVVEEELAPTGWAVATGTTDNNPVIPLVGAFVKVRNRFASTPQRLAAILETVVCAWPGCSVAAAKCHTHHITAYHQGGLTTGENLIPLCKKHNGMNDDNPDKPCNGRIERDPTTGRPGLRRHPGAELEFNNHPAAAKGIHKAKS